MSTASSAKTIERHRGHGFKIRGVQIDCAAGQQLLHGGMHTVEGVGEALRGDRPAIDLDALGGLGEVGRGEETGAPPRGAQSGFDHGAGGTFSIGARDVNEAGAVLRAAERVEYLRDAFEAEFGGLDFVAQRVEEVDRIGVVHRRPSHSEPRASASGFASAPNLAVIV